jgi:hypothetical protein
MPALRFARLATSPSVSPREFRSRRTVAPIWRETLPASWPVEAVAAGEGAGRAFAITHSLYLGRIYLE